MQVYYCSTCGKRIPLEQIEEGKALEIEGQMYCAECVEAQTPVATAVEVEVVPEGPMYCDRCNALIEPADLESGKAVSAGGQSYCAKCTAMYLPLLEALKEKESHREREEPVHHRRRTPAYGMRTVASERQAEHYAPAGYEGYEKKSSATAIMAIVGIVLVLIIILAVVMSSSPTHKPRDRGGPGPIVQPGPGPGPPPGPDRPRETPKYVEDPRVKTAIEAADSFAEMNPEAYVAIISRYEQIERDCNLSTFQSSHVAGAINATIQKRRNKALEARDRLLKEADALAKKGDYSGAIAALEKYPDNLKPVEDCWGTVQARMDQLDKDQMATMVFEALVPEVEKLKKDKKEEEGIAKLKKFMKDYAGSSFVTKAHDMLTELEKIVEERKAAAEAAERKAAEELAEALKTLRNSAPLYYADFTGKDFKANMKVEYKDCEYPHKGGQGDYVLAFLKLNASATFEFNLLHEPKHAILHVSHVIPFHSNETGNVILTFELNGKAIERNKRYVLGEADEELKFDVAKKLMKGKNTLRLSFPSGNVRWFLQQVELRAYHEGNDIREKEKSAAEAAAKTAAAQFKKWQADEKRKIENERKRLAKKFERGALPALKPGKYNLLKDKNLKGWKVWGEGGEWKMENGELVGRNNNLAQSSILATNYRRQYEWQDYTLKAKFRLENSSEHRFYLRANYPDKKDGMPEGMRYGGQKGDIPLGKELEVAFVVKGNKINVFVDGKENVKDADIRPEFDKGFIGLQLGPNATIIIKELTLELKR